MHTLSLDDAEIEYEDRGDGEPVLLIHGGGFAEAFKPMAAHPAFAGYRTVRHHRRGHAGSTGDKPGTVDAHASDARALLQHLDVGPAHVVGHSYGGSTALQLAVDAPELVHSLCLLEPGINFQLLDNSEALLVGVTELMGRYASGDREGAVEMFITGIMGPEGKHTAIASLGRGAWDQFVADADDAFESDMPSLLVWGFGAEQAGGIAQPAQLVMGECSDEPMQTFLGGLGQDASDFRMFGQVADLLRAWMPQLTQVTLPGLNHGLEFQDLEAVTAVVADFITQHPVGVAPATPRS